MKNKKSNNKNNNNNKKKYIYIYLKKGLVNETFSVTLSFTHRKSYALLASPFFIYTTLCDCIEHYTARIDYNHIDIYIYIYMLLELE